MSNFLDYLDWRGDLPLARDAFNEVDNLILAQLAYTDFHGIVPAPEEGFITLREAAARYESEGRDQSFLSNDPAPLLKKAAASERFGGTQLSAFVNEVDEDEQLQFAAMCFTLSDSSVYVAFRGTDNTIVGWREDFNLCFLSETPGQCRATRYLNGAAARYADAMLRVGGHSKGGNLAFYAAAFCDSEVKDRLIAVYSNDGPGFRDEVTQREPYRAVFHKLKKIVPENAIIGLLLTASEEPRVIKSSADGIQQHNPYSWEVQGNRFVRAEKLTTFSELLEQALHRWVDQLSDEERYSLVSAIFDSLDAVGVKTFTELNANRVSSYMAILRAARGLDPVLQKELLEIGKKLAGAGKDVIWDEMKKSFVELVKA